MKKKLFLLFIVTFCMTNKNATFANSVHIANTIISVAFSEDSKEKEYVDSVVAQDANGYETKNLGIYGRRLANGKYHYFAKTEGGTREFNIQYADRNKYKPFYVIINNKRWYFSSRELDYNSGKTDQW